jgi:hypothetical protein
MPSLTIEARVARADDVERLHAALERARASAGGTGATRTLDELRWRYAAAPDGACVAIAAEADGTLVAGIAATRRRALLEGREVAWLEVGDVFNDFARGVGLSRARGLAQAGEAFGETFGGFAPERHPVMYGLPNRRAHRFGRVALEWEVLRSENELVLDLARAAHAPERDVTLEEVERFPAECAATFQAFAATRAAVLVRDAAVLDWRYGERTGAGFQRVLARRGGALVGWAVLRDGALLEWLAPPDDEGLARTLLAWAAARARAEGHARLTLVVPDGSPEWLTFQRLGFRVHGTREYLCFKSFQRPAIMSWMFHHWFYTRGDTLR